MLGLINRGELEGSTEHELENLTTKINKLWLKEHNTDGTHKIDIMGVASAQHTHDAADIVSGTLDVARIPDLDAAKITTGTFADARLPAEVAYEDEANVFTQDQRINAGLGINVAPGATGEIKTSAGIYERSRTVAQGEWQAYTPSWTASTTNPTLGNGSLFGRYALIGKTCYVLIRFTFGSTSNAGVGAWRFSLPIAVSSNWGDVAMVARWTDSGTAHHLGVVTSITTSTIAVLNEGNTGSGIGAGIPIVWATNDAITINGFFEID